jgi:hypothetical protein
LPELLAGNTGRGLADIIKSINNDHSSDNHLPNPPSWSPAGDHDPSSLATFISEHADIDSQVMDRISAAVDNINRAVGPTDHFDFQPALNHELGHLVGLDNAPALDSTISNDQPIAPSGAVTAAIPEPTTLVLLAYGSLIMLRRQVRKSATRSQQ